MCLGKTRVTWPPSLCSEVAGRRDERAPASWGCAVTWALCPTNTADGPQRKCSPTCTSDRETKARVVKQPVQAHTARKRQAGIRTQEPSFPAVMERINHPLLCLMAPGARVLGALGKVETDSRPAGPACAKARRKESDRLRENCRAELSVGENQAHSWRSTSGDRH
jgi:hypothetical protein